jgi:hypothetical protein
LAFAQIAGFAHAYVKWSSDSEAYTTYTVMDNLPQPVINHLKVAPIWTPERVASDSVLLKLEPSTGIEDTPLEAVSQAVRLAGQVPDLTRDITGI